MSRYIFFWVCQLRNWTYIELWFFLTPTSNIKTTFRVCLCFGSHSHFADLNLFRGVCLFVSYSRDNRPNIIHTHSPKREESKQKTWYRCQTYLLLIWTCIRGSFLSAFFNELYPLEIRRTLPTIFDTVQKPVLLKMFGSITASRETFKKVCVLS